MHYFDLAIIIVYLVAITAFGARFRSGQKNLKDYFLGGRTALAQLGHPRAKHRGLLLQRAGLDFTLADHLQAEGVFLVRPVQGQKGRKLLGGVRFGIVLQHSFGLFASKTRWLILGEELIERPADNRSEEHTSELQSLRHLVCRLLLEKKK